MNYLKNIFKVETPSLMYKVLHKTNDKGKNSKLVNLFNSGFEDLKKKLKRCLKKKQQPKSQTR